MHTCQTISLEVPSHFRCNSIVDRPLICPKVRTGGINTTQRELILPRARGSGTEALLEELCSFQVKVSNDAGIFAHKH